MKVYRVYEISDVVKDRNKLTEEQIANIESVIKMVMENIISNKVLYQIPIGCDKENHPIARYNEKVYNKSKPNETVVLKEMKNLADKLLSAEQIDKDGSRRRSKSIKQGILFIKHTEEQLILLKVEEAKVLDKITFKAIEGLSIDNQYYKIAVIQKSSNKNIMIVDKNKVIAKYWTTSFLNLERQRDSYTNTTDILEFLEDNKLINNTLNLENNDYDKIKQQIRDQLFQSKKFDKDEIFSSLKFDRKKYDLTSENLFDISCFEKLDSSFEISGDALSKRYKKTIRTSDSAVIKIDNLLEEVRRSTIEISGNKVILTIDSNFKKNVKEIFKSVERI